MAQVTIACSGGRLAVTQGFADQQQTCSTRRSKARIAVTEIMQSPDRVLAVFAPITDLYLWCRIPRPDRLSPRLALAIADAG